MKKIYIVIVLFGLLMSCTEDDDQENPTENEIGQSFFTLDGTDYTMASLGGLENYGTLPGEHEGTNLDLILVSNASGLAEAEDGQDAISISDNYLDIEMYSTSNDLLSPGQYTFSNSQPHPTFSFSDGDYDIDEASTGIQDIVGGEVNVDITNDQYEIRFELLDDVGNTVSGSFNGQLVVFNIDPD